MKKFLIGCCCLGVLFLMGCQNGINMTSNQTGDNQTWSLIDSGLIDTGTITTGEIYNTGALDSENTLSWAIWTGTTGWVNKLIESKIKSMIERRKEEITKEETTTKPTTSTTKSQDNTSTQLNEKDIKLLESILDEIATGSKK